MISQAKLRFGSNNIVLETKRDRCSGSLDRPFVELMVPGTTHPLKGRGYFGVFEVVFKTLSVGSSFKISWIIPVQAADNSIHYLGVESGRVHFSKYLLSLHL